MVNANNLDEMFNTLRNTEPYLADDGFTSGVIAMLPEAKQLPLWITNLILLGFTAVGSAVAAWQFPVMKLISLTKSSIPSLPAIGSLPATGSLAVLGVAAIGTFMASYVVIWLAQNDSI